MGYLRNIRYYILSGSLILSGLIYLHLAQTIPSKPLLLVNLEELYGLISLLPLYLFILIDPFCQRYKDFAFRNQLLYAKRALGIAAFYFAFIHSDIVLFGIIGGINALPYIGNEFLFSVICGTIALVIMYFLTITSFEWVIKKITVKRWRQLYNLIYVCAILTLIHIVIIGTHYQTLSDPIPQITFFATVYLLYLETSNIDKFLKRYFNIPRFGFSALILSIIFTAVFIIVINPFNSSAGVSFNPYAMSNMQMGMNPQSLPGESDGVIVGNVPGLTGDKNIRYTVSFNDPQGVLPGQNTTLSFRVFNASSGVPILKFQKLFGHSMEAIITNSTLNYFQHIPVTQNGLDFSVQTIFPENGVYHIYLQFQPDGGISQLDAFSLPVGDTLQDEPNANIPVNTKFVKRVNGFTITMNTHGSLSAAAMTLGNQTITFTLKHIAKHKVIKSFTPYFDTDGYLTMINEKTYDFIHVNQANAFTSQGSEKVIAFVPMGIYGPFTPGIYRIFAEFKPDNTLITADFTVQVNK